MNKDPATTLQAQTTVATYGEVMEIYAELLQTAAELGPLLFGNVTMQEMHEAAQRVQIAADAMEYKLSDMLEGSQ